MIEHDAKLLDHEYDGIRELDNNLPQWWLWLLWFTLAWGVLYFAYYHILGIGYSSADEYLLEMNSDYVRHQESDTKVLGIIPQYHSPLYDLEGDMTPWMISQGMEKVAYVEVTRESDTSFYTALVDLAAIQSGKKIFTKSCMQCHGKVGEGGIGPNLTDDYWLHGAGMTNIVKSMKYGYPAKGMISWRGFLTEDEIIQTASYVITLRGSNPPNGKQPQGELVTEFTD